MARIRLWAAVAAFLALSGAAGEACQLSLVGPVTQQPLTYNPFQARATTAAVSFSLRNADSKPCSVAFAFFKPTAPQANAAGGGALAYQVLSASGGLLTQVAVAPPMSISGGRAAFLTVGAKQTVPVNAAISVPQGQVVGAGSYTEQLTLGIYQSPGGGTYTKAAPDTPLSVAITVNSQMILSTAGGGRTTTVDFGNLVEGAVRTVHLLAYANQAFHLVVSSDNAFVMKPVKGGPGQVPYTVSIFKTQVNLAHQESVSLWPKATQSAGLTIPVVVTVGSIAGQPPGNYRDVITIAIDPGP